MRPIDEDELTGESTFSCEFINSSSTVCFEKTGERRTSCGLPIMSLGKLAYGDPGHPGFAATLIRSAIHLLIAITIHTTRLS
jgi:hypothetical protein